MYPTVHASADFVPPPPPLGNGPLASGSESLYPTIGRSDTAPLPVPPPVHSRPAQRPPYQSSASSNGPAHASGSPSSQFPLLRVQIAEKYRTQPPILINPGLDDIPRSQATFDFELERRILADTSDTSSREVATSALKDIDDPFALLLERFQQMGYERDEIAMALTVHQDAENEQEKVIEFCKNYRQLKQMGFPPPTIAAALMLHSGDLQAATDSCLHAS